MENILLKLLKLIKWQHDFASVNNHFDSELIDFINNNLREQVVFILSWGNPGQAVERQIGNIR